jgi:hypothetical protein
VAMALPDPHPDLPAPRQRPRCHANDRVGRVSTYDLRRASGMQLRERVDHQTDRDALLHRLERIDERFAELGDERRAIVDELAALRDELYPVVTWSKGRRPPRLDHAPLPPALAGSQTVSGRDLRAVCQAILRRHGPLGLTELHAMVHRYGYVVGARRPVTALSDAMAYEVECGRARRVERGVYEAVGWPKRHRSRWRPTIPPHPDGYHLAHAPTPLDPDLDDDPSTWTVTEPLIPPG